MGAALTAILALAFSAHALPAGKASPAPRIPLVGLQGNLVDACPAIGRVSASETVSDRDFAVLAYPGDDASQIRRLELSTLVWLCEADGKWQGVVFPKNPDQDLGDCRVSTPLADPEPYSGPCDFGWIMAENIDLSAG